MTRDPLDELSAVFVERTIMGGKVQVELTFRQLQHECLRGAGQMVLWDKMGPRLRLQNQEANDPDYKPIEPNTGQRKYRRWRG